MIDIKFLRENPEIVKENIRKKFQDSKLALVDEVIELDAEVRKAQQEADDIRANRNRISKEIGALLGQGTGLPELRPGRFVKVSGLSQPLNGSYYVHTVRHTLDETGFETNFEAED